MTNTIRKVKKKINERIQQSENIIDEQKQQIKKEMTNKYRNVRKNTDEQNTY